MILGVIYPPNATIQSLATTAWTVYALACDNVLSWQFLLHIYRVRKALPEVHTRLKAQFRIVRFSLIVLCMWTWIGLSLSLVSILKFSNNQSMRTFFFRMSMALSPLAYCAALVYMYTVRTIFFPASSSNKNLKKDSSTGGSSNRLSTALNTSQNRLSALNSSQNRLSALNTSQNRLSAMANGANSGEPRASTARLHGVDEIRKTALLNVPSRDQLAVSPSSTPIGSSTHLTVMDEVESIVQP
ncbi:hypothetical protein DFS34DRAFT_657053 [Phlyctochytrium arcticum]|nr:hypothetical protein DFS34DRAFT_657053 [Phlyctochytrium arcticum]